MASVLWTDLGFDYSEGLRETCTRITQTLSDDQIIDQINNSIGNQSPTVKEAPFNIKVESGRERVKVVHYSNLSIGGIDVEDFAIRIHVCNRALGMKCKITVFSVFDLKSMAYLSAKRDINAIRQKHREICDLIYSKIADEFGLGGVNYTSCITTVESKDHDIDSIVQSTFAKDVGKFEFLDSVGERKIADTWRLLLDDTDGSTLEQKTEVSDIEMTLARKIYEGNVDEFKIKIYQNKKIVIPALVVNYAKEVSLPFRRFITAITSPECGVQVTKKILRSYLNRT